LTIFDHSKIEEAPVESLNSIKIWIRMISRIFSAILHYHYSVLYLSKQNLETVLKEIKQDTHSHVAGTICSYFIAISICLDKNLQNLK